jgi:sulfur-oxidizing protein SoxA
LNISNGESLFNKPFANGKTYGSCFDNDGIGIRQNYPYFDTERGEVITLELAINECREANAEKPLKWKKGAIANISAYMASTSRGNVFDIQIPDDPRALAAYERGKKHFYQKRGQLNMACADCHKFYSGNKVRADLLSPALGHMTHFPVYRSKWGGLGTAHRRYGGCNKQVRAKPFPAQSEEYRALEYFHTYMSNGLAVNGPGARK